MFYLPEVFANVNSVGMGTNELTKRLGKFTSVLILIREPSVTR